MRIIVIRTTMEADASILCNIFMVDIPGGVSDKKQSHSPSNDNEHYDIQT